MTGDPDQDEATSALFASVVVVQPLFLLETLCCHCLMLTLACSIQCNLAFCWPYDPDVKSKFSSEHPLSMCHAACPQLLHTCNSGANCGQTVVVDKLLSSFVFIGPQ